MITGASSGNRCATALRLAQIGWHVFAAVRRRSDAPEIRARGSGALEAVLLDLTDHESIARVTGNGISQGRLAQAVDTTRNTVSRWETATYKPSIFDLEKLAHFFGTPITFFSRNENPNHERTPISLLLRTSTTKTSKRHPETRAKIVRRR